MKDILSRWNWYRTIADITQDGHLGRTSEEVELQPMHVVLRHLAFLQDMQLVEKLKAQEAPRVVNR